MVTNANGKSELAHRAHVELRTAEAVVTQYSSDVALAGYGDRRRAVRQLDVEGGLAAKEVDVFRGSDVPGLRRGVIA